MAKPKGKYVYFIFHVYNPGEERGVNGSQNESHIGCHNFPPATVKNRMECVMGDDSDHCILKKSGATVLATENKSRCLC